MVGLLTFERILWSYSGSLSTVVFLKLDRGNSFFEGKMSRIVILVEVIKANVKTMVVY